ncbi:MAG TPA: isoleucine--tRNA ligase [Verrucomicrobiae bacterium]|nr:isoleucine--tRNA ligase [Verrucomicrobiae bacterium]
MKFEAGKRRKAIDYEKDLVQQWKRDKTFEKSVEQRSLVDNSWVFYDGPPFLTGLPHHGTLLISTVKDTMGRYHSMLGQHVERRWGWDCHGLPAELFVEKKLGIASKKEIGDKISIADYVKECRAAMVKTGTEWEDTIDRIGRWVEFEGAYKTMDKEYMESVWWAFKRLYDEGKVYEGEKILVYCTKDATPISKSEIAMENSYQRDTDPSVYVYFKLEDSDDYLLAWTTTPWTLPANVAIAVNERVEYSLLEYEGKRFYVATDAVKHVMQNERRERLNFKTVKTVMGKDLTGRRYRPLFENRGPEAHRVLHADFVTVAEGTGIVHEAPAYGEDDFELCKRENVPVISLVDENGIYTEGPWFGKNIWDVNKQIAKTLVANGKALKVEYVTHEYPHCHRCGSKLMYRAHPSWFMDIQGQKLKMLSANENETSWMPAHLKDGRFHNIIESAPDWNLSRDRYWATPIPVWQGERPDGTPVTKVIGSYKEFAELTGKNLDDYHLPMVMDVTFECDGVQMHHIGKVLDCWFESGSMPFAQFHYPFEHKEKFEESFPADFIVEAIDQTRGWFYSLMAVNVGLFGEAPFKNVICTGLITAGDGKKFSKKLKNYTDPMVLMDQYSADAFRFLVMSSPVVHGENFALNDKDVQDVQRKLAMIWNMYDFFTLYASVDGWEWGGVLNDPLAKLSNPLDIWILSRLHQLQVHIKNRMDGYDIASALEPVLAFVDDASNWYVRRSRRRFWKSGDDIDKTQAYQTLHYLLLRLSMLLAPFMPFLAEELFQKLTGGIMGKSVHLLDWPSDGEVDEDTLKRMAFIRDAINEGLSQRAANKIKVRQPLTAVRLEGESLEFLKRDAPQAGFYTSILLEELNVKKLDLQLKKGELVVSLDLKVTQELKREGIVREIIRQVQSARKAANLKVDDRILLVLETSDDEMRQAIVEYGDSIKAETLAVSLNDSKVVGYSTDLKIDDYPVTVRLVKA